MTLDGDDISASCARAELVINAAEIETTDFGSEGFTEVIGGLKSGTLSLDFHNDFGAGGVSTLFADLVGETAVITLAPNGSTAAADNPVYTATILVNSFTPISGAVGDLATFSVSFPTTGSVTYVVV